MWTSFISSMLFSGLAMPVDADDAIKKEMEMLVGTWSLTVMIKDGEPVDNKRVQKTVILLVGDKLRLIRDENEDEAYQISIDPSKKPAAIALRLEKQNVHLNGIYSIDKDTLKICYGLEGGDRPTEFDSKKKSGTGLMVFKRVK